MNPFDEILAKVHSGLEHLIAEGTLPEGLDTARVGVEPPREAAHGDAASNAALVLAKQARTKPMAVALALAERLRECDGFIEVQAAPPGFVNMRLAPSFWQEQVRRVLETGEDYGRSSLGGGCRVNVEYCSANPTGPLHVGHARGSIVGDALASLLAFTGHRVTREYYINDGGAQIEALARSIHHRYLEALGRDPGPVPEGLYPLEELVPIARHVAERDGDRWVAAAEEEWIEHFGAEAVAAMMDRIKADLAMIGVRHDIFTSERVLVEQGKVDAALAHLDRLGLLYTGTLSPPKGKPVEDWEPVPQLLFKATAFGDDSDRPLRRSTGAWTYFAADLAYHLDKYCRGAEFLIDVWGADHAGYIKRMQAGVKALSEGRVAFDVKLCQLVNLLDAGEPLKMSKRAGRIVTLKDVVDEVGRDVFRFIMLFRKNDAALDFDLAKVVEQSKDNPVFYVQYAHARIRSVLRNAAEAGYDEMALGGADLSLLQDEAELTLIKRMALFPRTVEGAAVHHEPHRIAFYLHELASDFHALWTRGKEQSSLRFLIEDAPELTRARLAMLVAVRRVLAQALGVLGVEPVETMY